MALDSTAIGPISNNRHNNAPLDYGISAETFPYYEFPSDGRLPQTVPWAPQTPINALRIMNLTDPNGRPVTFMPGEALPGWAQQYR